MVFYTHPGCEPDKIGDYIITREDYQYHLVKVGKQYETLEYNDFFLPIPPGPRTPVKSPHKATTSPLTETKMQLYYNRTYDKLRSDEFNLEYRVNRELENLHDTFYQKQSNDVKKQIQQAIIARIKSRNARDSIYAAGEGGGADLQTWPMGR